MKLQVIETRGTVTCVENQPATELLEAALDGDRQAWDALVAEYTGLLWWVARSHRLDDATAADVVQTVWLQLVQHGRSIRDVERLPGWLATTARRESLRRIATSRRQLPTDAVDDAPAIHDASPEERIVDDEVRGIALAAFHRLGDRCRALLTQLCLDPPRSYDEISAVLGMPVGSIGPTRQRCLSRLRLAMGEMGFA